MRRITICLLVLWIAIFNEIYAVQDVSYFEGTISDLDGKYLKFLSGSSWLLEHKSYAIPFSKGVIVFKGHDATVDEKDIEKRIINLPNQGMLFYKGEEIAVTLLDGIFIRKNGTMTTVEKEMGNGAILQTEDGTLWSVPSYDQYDTGYWLPPYKVLIDSNELYMTNLEKGKKIWITKVK